MVGLRQEVPVVAALDQDALGEAEDARAEVALRKDAARGVWREAASLCIEWTVAARLAAHWRTYAGHIRDVRDALVAAYSGGASVSAGRLVRTDATIARAERRVADLEERGRVARETLAALAGDPAAVPPEPLPLPAPPAALDVDELLQTALVARGDVEAARARTRAAGARAEAASATADIPRFEVSASYMQMPGARPGLGAEVMMTMPWLGGGLAGARTAAGAEEQAVRSEAAVAERAAAVEVRRDAARLQAARRVLAQIADREVPAAERASAAERAAMSSGTFDLVSWLLAAEELIEARIDEEEARGEVARAWIELTAAAGLTHPAADQGNAP